MIETTVFAGNERVVSSQAHGARHLARTGDGFAWVDLHEPSAAEVAEVAAEFGLDELVEEEVLRPHRRPGYETWDDAVFLRLRPARPVVEGIEPTAPDVLAVVGLDYAVTARWGGGTSVANARRQLERMPDLLRWGPMAVLVVLVEEVVDGYDPAIDALEGMVEAMEGEVFAGLGDPSRRIYEHSRSVAALLRATRPVAEALGEVLGDFRDERARVNGVAAPDDMEAERYTRRVRDRMLRVTERLEDLKERLSTLLAVNLSVVAVRQNDQRQDAAQRISAWAAILAIPAIVTGVYGMNFSTMPELGWTWGYPMALGLTALAMGMLYGRFKRTNWL